MPFIDQLPSHVADLILSRFVCEFATVSKAGVPINSPLVPFISEDRVTIDTATGLAYPTKADRVRRNPKVGMLFEGEAHEPVVSIAGYGAVRDSDFQSNLERYLAEEILTPVINPALVDYSTTTHPAIWYFTRIITEVKPALVRWWPDRASTDEVPSEWRAPAGTVYPQSDPAPPGEPSKGSWAATPWRELAESALTRGAPAMLTLLDDQGFPLPVRARAARADEAGFRFDMPRWLPWSSGPATVSFQGLETFIGEAEVEEAMVAFRVDRIIPIHPLLAGGPLHPDEQTKRTLMARIEHELRRRGKPLPKMPDTPPAPTRGALVRERDTQAFTLTGGGS